MSDAENSSMIELVINDSRKKFPIKVYVKHPTEEIQLREIIRELNLRLDYEAGMQPITIKKG